MSLNTNGFYTVPSKEQRVKKVTKTVTRTYGPDENLLEEFESEETEYEYMDVTYTYPQTPQYPYITY